MTPTTRTSRPYAWLPALLSVLLVAAVVWSSLAGVVKIAPADLLSSDIFVNLRLPRIVTAILVGAALSVSGAAYQSVFRNPLTDPYVLGVSSGASLGAAVAIVAGLENSTWGIGAAALLSALATVWLIYRVAAIGNRLHTSTLLLTGVCLTLLLSAVVTFLMVLHQDKMERIVFWTMGSFSSSSWFDVALLLPVVLAGSFVVIYLAKDLNLLLAGSETARSLGVEVERVKRLLLLATTLMVAFAVSSCGVIGFVGLIVPHCMRLVCGPDNRRVVPCSLIGGALFMLLCDTASRTLLQPAELPVGSITAIVGAPLFIYLLYRNKKSY
ncbi:MAG: iron ABC transporter permease [Bacteroidales bacterium]|nr:iron ABC transporter permease [Bacteroidales bacterium]